MKKGLLICLSLLPVMVPDVPASARGPNFHQRNHTFKNVIWMIPDGCDETVQTLARKIGNDLSVANIMNQVEERNGGA